MQIPATLLISTELDLGSLLTTAEVRPSLACLPLSNFSLDFDRYFDVNAVYLL